MKQLTSYISNQFGKLTLLQKLMLPASGLIFLSNLNTFENNTYPSFLAVLMICLLGIIFSKSFRLTLAESFNAKILILLVLGFFIRLHFSLFSFVHMNYHGMFYLLSISKLMGFEETPYGFTYNIFWYPFKYFIGSSRFFLFYANIVLNMATSYLFYIIIKRWTKKESLGLLAACLFIFSPLQVSIAATESHFVLYSFFLLLLLCFSEEPSSHNKTFLPFMLAFMTFLRPTLFLIYPSFIIYLFLRKKMSRDDLFYSLLIFSLIVVIPFTVAFLSLYNVFFHTNLPVFTVAQKAGHTLNIFKTKYYTLIYSLLVGMGLMKVLFTQKMRTFALALSPIIFLVLMEAILKHSEWHISMYYQTTIEIFYFLLIIVTASFFENGFRKKKIFLYSMIVLVLFFQLYSKLNIYNTKYDEQIEQDFVDKTLNKYEQSGLIFTTYHDIGKGSEFFSPIIFFDKNLNITNTITSVKDILSENFSKQYSGNKIYYRSLSEHESSFKEIERIRGLIPLDTYTFIFHQRFYSHIAEGSNATVGFYQITK